MSKQNGDLAGSAEVYFDGVRYKLAKFPEEPDLPWIVYGGNDGSVLVYIPERDQWKILNQTLKTNDYYFVSISQSRGRRFQPYVHQVILHAFYGPPPQSNCIGKHLNDDGKDNRPENLRWGTKTENMLEAHSHRRSRTAPLERRISVPISRRVVNQLKAICEYDSVEDYIDTGPNNHITMLNKK